MGVLVFTNVLPPYRQPVWESFAASHRLTVRLAADLEADRGWRSLVASEAFPVEAFNLPKFRVGETYLYLPTPRWLRLGRAEAVVVGGWESPAYLALLLVCRSRKVPSILFYESTVRSHAFQRGPVAWLRKNAMKLPTKIICPGSAATQAVLAMGVPAERVVTGFNTVDVEWFHRTAGRLRANAASSPGHKFIYVGQLIERKNIAAVIDAFAKIRQPHDSLTIVGQGPLRKPLEMRAAELGLGDSVEFTGPKSGEELVAEYAKANTLVLASTNEVWGLVANEALACGLQVVISDQCGATPDIQGMQGVHVCQTDTDSIAIQLDRACSSWQDPITLPEILKHTPQMLADAVAKALPTQAPPVASVVAWLTNIPSPYRYKLWEKVAAESRLRLGFLALNEPNRNLQIPELPSVEIAQLGVPKIAVGENFLYLVSWRLLKFVLGNYDTLILGGWDNPAYAIALLAAKLRRRRVILHYGSTLKSHRWKHGPLASLRKLMVNSVDGVYTYGSASTKAVLAMGVPAERVVTGFNTVDVEWFHQTAQLLRADVTPAPGHKFIYAGQLIERKNVAAVIDAFAKIREPHDSLTIVGRGPLRNALETRTSDLGLGDSVVFTGPKSGADLVAEYAKANTLVLASTNEVWGLVANEALACGLQVVISDQCGAAADIQGMQGVHVCQTDTNSIATQLNQARRSWDGPINSPQILEHTPETLAHEMPRPKNRAELT